MSSGANNFRPALANWHAARGSAARTSSNHDEPNMFAATSRSLQLIPDVGAGALIPWRPSEERMRTGPSGALIPWRPPEERMRTGPSGALAGRFPGGQLGQMSSPTPGFTGQLGNLQEKSRLTRDDKASKKLRKEIYNPSPKRITRRLNLYYRDNASNSLNEVGKKEELEEDGKRCPICWEDFEAREEVMLTPCDHMFHEECIMPWVKSNGQCPVCRYAFTDRERETTTTTSNVGLNNTTNIAYMAASDVLAVELISIIRAMDEALQWG